MAARIMMRMIIP